jgi:formylglycine-generating enzyme
MDDHGGLSLHRRDAARRLTMPCTVRPVMTALAWTRRCAGAGPAMLLALAIGGGGPVAAAVDATGIDWQTIRAPAGVFSIARTETTVGQFRRFVQATGLSTLAERRGGGQVYEAGWVRQPGWTWLHPFGGRSAAADDEPAVHIGFDEAQAFCRWVGGRLPTDAEWLTAAYTETRASPPPPFVTGRRYPYPTGDSPAGAQCLGDCGPEAQARALRHGARLWRGDGHARTGSTPAGVNGLHDMGGNAWEWVDEPPGASGPAERRARGGSWWYGAAQMRADHLQGKPADTTVVYIGFRCLRPG